MWMALAPLLCSNTQCQFHTTTKIVLTTPTISAMISLHSLLFGGQSGGLQDNFHLCSRCQKQMQQMQGKLDFHHALAEKMPTIYLDDDGRTVVQVGKL